METFIVTFILVLLGIIILAMAIRVVPEYKRLVVFRLGRCLGARGPGLILLIPYVDRGVMTDLREAFFDVPPQTCITADNASVSIDFLVYDKVIDPVRSVLEVENFTGAARGLAITTLRAVVGSMILDDVLSKRDEINRVLHAHFRPEFLNRVDEVIIFHSLGMEQIMKIVDIQVAGLKKRLAERKVAVELTAAAKEFLLQLWEQAWPAPRPKKATNKRSDT